MTQWETVKENYRRLDEADKILFWVHYAVAPALMITAAAVAFGWTPTLLFCIGGLLWKASEP